MKRPDVRLLAASAATALLLRPLLADLRVARPSRPLTDRWQTIPVEPRGSTQLGLSLRSPQLDAFGLDPTDSLRSLLAYPFQIIRLGAYWSRLEPAPGQFHWDELDRQVDAAEQAGKHIILAVGALKTFGYPEFFVPRHRLPQPIREGSLVTPASHPHLLAAAVEQVTRVVDRYRQRAAISAWQVEHEAVDPLGMEHSWRLTSAFVEREVAAVRAAGAARPILLNAYLPTSLAVGAQQWWRTRDQGDSLALAQRLADIVGLDAYPRHALLGLGPWTTYLDGDNGFWPRRLRQQLAAWAHASGKQLMITEGQAEPWEAVTTPPNPAGRVPYSCPTEQLIATYNTWLGWARESGVPLQAYLFWGAEYWLLRQQSGDDSYLRAFARVLEAAP